MVLKMLPFFSLSGMDENNNISKTLIIEETIKKKQAKEKLLKLISCERELIKSEKAPYIFNVGLH